MKISIVTQSNPATNATVLPLIQDQFLSAALIAFSKEANIDTAFLEADFKANKGEQIMFYVGQKRVYLLGLGKTPTENDLVKTVRSFFNKAKKTLITHTTIDVSSFDAVQIEAISNGFHLGSYDLDRFKTNDDKFNDLYSISESVIDIIVNENSKEEAIAAADRGQMIAETQIDMMWLGDEPANYKYPETLAEAAEVSGKDNGYSVTVYDEKECEDLGLKALLAVGKGSEHPPRFLVMEYRHKDAKQIIGLVGKGVTFDTGGISIKASANMHLMKSDMGGAAAVLGTMELTAKMNLPIHLVGIIPTTENSIDGLSTKPGDVIGSYLGKTIEVIDTDAEGRLILADGLAYLNKNFKPDVMIDLATLTGSVIGTLGYVAAGLFTNNKQLSDELSEAGQLTGEKLWQLPLWDDYEDELKSDIADLKNYHGKPFAGAIVAAKFLEVFTEKHPAWAHLDIAGTAFADSEYGTMKSATAYGVRLLNRWLRLRVQQVS